MVTKDKKSTDLTVKFGGELNELNVNTLLKSLASITTAIDEITNEIGEGQKLEIKIKALDKGSFLVHLGLIPTEMVDLISQVDWKLASCVLGSLVSLLTLRKLLQGKKPKSVEEQKDNVIVEMKSGNKVTIDKRTFHIYNSNVKVNEAISENFEALKSDSSIDSFEIESPSKETLFHSSKEDFEIMSAKGITEVPEERIKLITQSATLHIFKLVWDPLRKWEFYYRGTKISAIIADKAFFQKIDKGEQFAKGDSLEVELQINQVFDESVNTYVNESHVITKVLRHLPRPGQPSLFP